MIDRYINNKINAIWNDQNRFDTWKLIQEKYVETLEELKIAEAGIAKKIRAVASSMRLIQTGFIYHYAFVMIIGLLLFLLFFYRF